MKKISEMTEKEFNRTEMLQGQVSGAYEEKTKSFRTEQSYEKAVGEFAKYLAVETKMEKMDNFKARHVIGFAEQMKEDGLSASTQKTYLAAIRDYADRIGMDQRNIPTNDRLDLDRRSFGNVDRKWTEEEFKDFKETAKEYDSDKGEGPKMELLLDVAKEFGCRLEGILNLDLNAINNALETGELHTKEKAGKDNVKPVDNDNRRDLLERVKEYGEENGQRKIFVPDNFKTSYQEAQDFIKNYRNDIQDGDRMNNIDARNSYKENGEVVKGNLTWHGLRHNYATEKFEEFKETGMGDKEAMLKTSQLMGHERAEITKIYLAN